MRVTAQTKATTRQKILDAGRRLFAGEGFDGSTTRQIADAAGIAAGTVFNYFATKEQILASLVAEAMADAQLEFAAQELDGQSFEEVLFAFVMAGLRKLKPLRRHLAVLLDTALSPLAAGDDEAESFRTSHLEIVATLARKHLPGELSPVALQLYWTLYTGLLMFWANDRSARQEDTLALLDESLAMFVGWIGGNRDRAKP